MLAQRVYYYLDPLCAVPTFIRPTFPLHYQYKQKPTPKDRLALHPHHFGTPLKVKCNSSAIGFALDWMSEVSSVGHHSSTENGRYIEKMLAQRVYYYLDPLCVVPSFIRPTFPLHYKCRQKPKINNKIDFHSIHITTTQIIAVLFGVSQNPLKHVYFHSGQSAEFTASCHSGHLSQV